MRRSLYFFRGSVFWSIASLALAARRNKPHNRARNNKCQEPERIEDRVNKLQIDLSKFTLVQVEQPEKVVGATARQWQIETASL